MKESFLNTEHIACSTDGVEYHPLRPFLPENARLLFLGSFPPQRKRREKGLAFYDTSTAVRRLQDNASDKFLEVVEPTDIPALIQQLPHLRAIVTTGEKATDTICSSLQIPHGPKVNTFVTIPERLNTDGESIVLYRLPSSSRAYPLAFDKKVEAYKRMFEQFLSPC